MTDLPAACTDCGRPAKSLNLLLAAFGVVRHYRCGTFVVKVRGQYQTLPSRWCQESVREEDVRCLIVQTGRASTGI